MRTDKQSEEEALIESAVKTTIELLCDIRLFNRKNNADEIKDYCFTKRRRCSPSGFSFIETNDIVQWFRS